MKEISKKDLLFIINESEHEIDELAQEKKLQGIRKERGDLTGKPSRLMNLFHPNTEKYGEYFTGKKETKRLPDALLLNPSQKSGEGVLIILLKPNQTSEEYVSVEDLKEFKDELERLYGKDKDNKPFDSAKLVDFVKFVDFVKLGHSVSKPNNPQKLSDKIWRNLKDSTGVDMLTKPEDFKAQRTGGASSREMLLRGMNQVIHDYLVTPEVNNKMFLSGYQPIVWSGNEEAVQKRHINRYSKKENDLFVWTSVNIYTFHTFDEFSENAEELLDLQAMDPDSREFKVRKGESMARLFNQQTANWSITRKQEKEADRNPDFKRQPLTPIHKMEKGGFQLLDKDYVVETKLSITGETSTIDGGGQTYTWQIMVETKLGEKLREESAGRGLYPDKDFYSSAETPLLENVLIHNGQPLRDVLDHPKIRKAFVVALDGVKKQIMEFDPTKSLESRILKTRKDVTKTMKLSESDLNRIVQNIIGEMEK
jgi:hypothetical protein